LDAAPAVSRSVLNLVKEGCSGSTILTKFAAVGAGAAPAASPAPPRRSRVSGDGLEERFVGGQRASAITREECSAALESLR